MGMIEPILQEFEQEAATTRTMLERVPDEAFGWKPHEKSMTLGRLASHIAEIPGWAAALADQDEFTLDENAYVPAEEGSTTDVLALFDQNVKLASEKMKNQSDERLMATWRMRRGNQILVEMPRIGVFHGMMLKHIVHHRGQLSVYLRLQNVPVPPSYGPTADMPM